MLSFADCHSHTYFSHDAREDASPDQMLSRAAAAGLAVYGITDHCEADDPNPAVRDTLTELSIKTIASLKERNPYETQLLCGVELGQAMFNLEFSKKIAGDERLDFLLASLHNLKEQQDYYWMEYEDESLLIPLMEAYYESLEELAGWNAFDILGHITYPLRYIIGRAKKQFDTRPLEGYVDRILKVVAESGKALEVNTSGLRQPYGRCLPDFNEVKRFRELGGKYVSLGSDAHNPDDVGAGIKEGAAMVKEAGFDCLCYFKNRRPQLIKL